MIEPVRLTSLLLPLGAGLFAVSTAWAAGQGPVTESAATAGPVEEIARAIPDAPLPKAPPSTAAARVERLRQRLELDLSRLERLERQAAARARARPNPRKVTDRAAAPRITARTTARTTVPRPPSRTSTANPTPKKVAPKAPAPPPTHTRTGASR